MRNISAGWETDLSILNLSGSIIQDFNSHLVIRSPDNPEFHWGNFILVKDSKTIENATRWVEIFKENFPDATWTAIGLPKYPVSTKSWKDLALEIERLEVLKCDSMPKLANIDDAYTSRIFEREDWDRLYEYEIAQNLDSGEHDSSSFEKFIRNTISVRKNLCDQQKAAWFGAFHKEALVAMLGIVICGEAARYQDVQTDKKHRRIGLASHLLGEAAKWSAEMGSKSWVIVTESTNDAGRVYRRADFKPDIEIVTAYKSK